MKPCYYFLLFASAVLIASSCADPDDAFDASGAFEADETIISAEASGRLMEFDLEEGRKLSDGVLVGYIDSTQLYLRKKQLEAQIIAAAGRKPSVRLQLAALEEQLRSAERERDRVATLVRSDAATAKQLDDATAAVDVIRKQLDAQRSTLLISTTAIDKELVPLQVQIEQIEDQLVKCRIVNPVAGTVLARYAHEHEVASQGKPLYKIADLSLIKLRAYITGDQLPLIKLGDSVRVMTDDGQGGYRHGPGRVEWISDKAEFTPKAIQTRNERANMVYAVKVAVRNDGAYKIGMYGQIRFLDNGRR